MAAGLSEPCVAGAGRLHSICGPWATRVGFPQRVRACPPPPQGSLGSAVNSPRGSRRVWGCPLIGTRHAGHFRGPQPPPEESPYIRQRQGAAWPGLAFIRPGLPGARGAAGPLVSPCFAFLCASHSPRIWGSPALSRSVSTIFPAALFFNRCCFLVLKFFKTRCSCTLTRLQYCVSITFIIGTPKNSRDLLYFNTRFVMVIWTESEVSPGSACPGDTRAEQCPLTARPPCHSWHPRSSPLASVDTSQAGHRPGSGSLGGMNGLPLLRGAFGFRI